MAILSGCALVCFAQSAPSSPNLEYSSFFGGSESDTITALAQDSSGNIYVTGLSASANFPTTAGVYEPAYPGPSGDNAIFVSKFSAAGALLWSTFLGPGSFEFTVPSSIQVDAGENVYVAGLFQGTGFPTTAGLPNSGSVFITKLNSTGSALVYSTTIGGNSIVSNPKLVLDSSADAWIIGSGDICCPSQQSGTIGSLGGISDFWVAEINAAGNALPWSVQIGGTGDDVAEGLAIDSANKLYVTGYSDSSDFPVTTGALDQAGIVRTQVVKLDPTKAPGVSLVYSALLGDPANSPASVIYGESIAVDQSGNAYVGTWGYNTGLFVSKYAFQRLAPTPPNAYVFELNPTASALLNGTFLGGILSDYAPQISVDSAGNTYVAGFTFSPDFPTTAYSNPLQPLNVEQAYYVKLNPQFAAISSVVLDVSGSSQGEGLVLDGAGGLWLGGNTGQGLPTTPNAYQPVYGGNYDGFLLHTSFPVLCGNGGKEVQFCVISASSSMPERVQFSAQASNVEGADSMALSIDGINVYGSNSAQFDTYLPVAPGSHTASVTVDDTIANQYSAQQSFTVAASSNCPVNPLIPSLTFCSPLNAAVVQGTVTVQVVANDGGAPAVLQLYVDGKLQGTIKGQKGTYTTTLNLPAGIHTLSVTGEDRSLTYLSTSAAFRVTE